MQTYSEIYPSNPTTTASQQQTLFASVYPELKRIAARQMRTERTSHTLQATALVHEAFLRIARRLGNESQHSGERQQIFALASQIMKHILVDQARARLAKKRDGGCIATGEVFPTSVRSDKFSDLHQAIERLAQIDPRQAQVVEMRFFGGFTEDEIAEVLGVSNRTVKRDWILARTWLYGELCQ